MLTINQGVFNSIPYKYIIMGFMSGLKRSSNIALDQKLLASMFKLKMTGTKSYSRPSGFWGLLIKLIKFRIDG